MRNRRTPNPELRLGTDVLRSVSRSFYLSIRCLPKDLRTPISIAYLLARTSDTIADSGTTPPAIRIHHLRALRQMLETGIDARPIADIQRDIQPESSAERTLLKLITPTVDWFTYSSAFDRAEIAAVLDKIFRGQEFDLIREQTPSPDITATDLDEYTYLVAGSVGEFWTNLGFHYVEDFSTRDREDMVRLGINYGKGLQLINILRDLPADLAQGRCYLPTEELTAAGVVPSEILSNPEKCRLVFLRWWKIAATHLDDGFTYIESIKTFRLRIATLLPWLIGGQTLELLRQHPSLEAKRRIKVNRGQVRLDLLLAPFLASSNGLLARARNAHHISLR